MKVKKIVYKLYNTKSNMYTGHEYEHIEAAQKGISGKQSYATRWGHGNVRDSFEIHEFVRTIDERFINKY